MNVCCVCLSAVIAAFQVVGQQRATFFKPPFGPGNQLVSPDSTYALFGDDSKLWLEDERTHERKMVFAVTVQTASVAWSPDSAAFFVNDRAFSDVENAYICDVKTLERLDLAARITSVVGQEPRVFSKIRTNIHIFTRSDGWTRAMPKCSFMATPTARGQEHP